MSMKLEKMGWLVAASLAGAMVATGFQGANDKVGVVDLSKVFGDQVGRINVSATKGMTGHLLGAAGAVEAIAGVLAMQHDFVPPTINHFTDDPEIDPAFNLTFNEAQQRKVGAVLSNTFGFGGHNASIVFKQI